MHRSLAIATALTIVLATAVLSGNVTASADDLSISGTVWFDTNGDGIRQADDHGAFPWRLVLQGSGGVRTITQTDMLGNYTFANLVAGDYLVIASDSPVGQVIQTSPSRRVLPPFSQGVSLANVPISGVDFGIHRPEGMPAFAGLAFINAAPADSPEVRAFVDGVDCTFHASILPTDLDPATYQVSVLSSDELAGCGDNGDVITFTVNGLLANETAVWRPVLAGQSPLADGRGSLELTVGQAFAAYGASFVNLDAPADTPERISGGTVVALVDGQLCSVGMGRVFGSVLLIVPPSQLKPGCGYEGAIVTFAIDGFAVDRQEVWRAGGREGWVDSSNPSEEFVLGYHRSPGAELAGPAYAYYALSLQPIPDGYVGSEYQSISVTVDGKYCGGAGREDAGEVLVAVMPAAIEPGCGQPGDRITFSLQGKPFAESTWQPGFHDGPEVPDLNTHLNGVVTAGADKTPVATTTSTPGSQIAPPSVGDAGLR